MGLFSKGVTYLRWLKDAGALVRVINYIHLNPVRVHMVPAANCASYRWSSLRRLMHCRQDDE